MSTIFEQADKALEDLQMAYFLAAHPGICTDCEASRIPLREALDEFGLEFTPANLEFVIKEKPELGEQLAPAPVAAPKENAAQADARLREELTDRILQAVRDRSAGMPLAARQQRLDDLSRHFKYQTVEQLQQQLANLENQTRYESLSYEDLRKVTREEYAQRHAGLAGQQFPPIPPELDAKTIKKMIYGGQYDQLKRQYGTDALNNRLAGGI